MTCTGLFDHTLEKLETVAINKTHIAKRCSQCAYKELLPRSQRNIHYTNNLAMQKIKWSADDTKKELLQPMNIDGSVNDEFTKANGFNPFDDNTKTLTPKIQGGKA